MPITHSALCMLILSYCGHLTQLALRVAGVGDGAEGHRTVASGRLKPLCAGVKGS